MYELAGEKKQYNILIDKNRNFFKERVSFEIDKRIDENDIVLYKIDQLTYENKVPRREAFENIISSLREEGLSFLYLLMGDKEKVSFYLGVVRDKFSKSPSVNIKDYGKNILKSTLEGNFRGSKVNSIEKKEKAELLKTIRDYDYFGLIDGVPGINESEDKSSFQGIDRLVDIMLGDKFGFGVLVRPLDKKNFQEIENRLYELYRAINPMVKYTYQLGNNIGINEGKNISENISKGSSQNTGFSFNEGINESKTDSDNTTKGVSDTKGSSSGGSYSSQNESHGTNSSRTLGDSKTKGTSYTTGSTIGKGTTETESINHGKNKGFSTGTSNTLGTELINKNAQEWIKYIDEVLVPIMDYGKSKGLFIATNFIFTENRLNLIKLSSTIQSLFSGRRGNKMPLKMEELEENDGRIDYLKEFQIPQNKIPSTIELERALVAESKFIKNDIFTFGNIYSPNEISILTGLPQKEVVGLSLREEVEFGLNFPPIAETDKIQLGHLIQTGRELKNIKIAVDKNSLDKHIFIAGVTGSGKTTTCQKILKKSNLPFLVIEPAKTEYRILMEEERDILIFPLGKDTVAPFRINPLEFFPQESITSRVAMIKASIEASFEMEAAIPQLIETIIYRCYEDYGWNITTNKNYKFDNPFEKGIYSFPTLKDVIDKIEIVVEEQGFDIKLKNDYIGSIKARLNSLIVGSKGFMLNTPRSIDFKELLNRKVILELEEIKNAGEKSLIMGFILGNIGEALKVNHRENKNFKHITLIEEAHRLLSKFTPGDSLNKKQGVELFSDMLAEVRKYGESLVIVDQIPNKLTPEVLKNTNTKIIHKIFAEDDKEAIGNTIALDNEQKKYLSSLRTGEVILFSQGWDKAIQGKIEKETDTTGKDEVEENKIFKNAIKYYSDNYKDGIIIGTQLLSKNHSIEEVENILSINQNFTCHEEYLKLVRGEIITEKDSKILYRDVRECIKFGKENMIKYLYCKYYLFLSYEDKEYNLEKISGELLTLINFIEENKIEYNLKKIFKERNYRELYI